MKLIAITTSVLVVLACGMARAEDPKPLPHDGPARVAKWKGDKKAAFTLTFDDGLQDQVEQAVPVLNEAGIKATFAVNPATVVETREQGKGKQSSWEDWRAAAKAGHEIGNHSMTHPKLTGQAKEKWDAEINGAKKVIEEKIGRPCVSFVYPFNAANKEVAAKVAEGHIVAVGGERAFYGYGKDAAFHNKIVDGVIDRGEWKVAMIHAVKSGYAAWASADAFKEHVAYLKGRQDVLWVDTLGAVAKYKQESEAATLKAEAAGKTVTLTLTCPLDPKIFDQALTVVIAAPGVRKAAATREGKPLPMTVRTDEVLVDIVPGDQKVIVTWE
jgi:peptidoglycan/xylan/chitin deacetylase (PgdA/CDA1 family)